MIIKNAPDSIKSGRGRYSFFTPLELKTLNHCAVDMPLLNPFHKNAIMRLQSQLGWFSRYHTMCIPAVYDWLRRLYNQHQRENLYKLMSDKMKIMFRFMQFK